MKTKRTLADFGKLWPAEVKIRDDIDSGNTTVIGKDVPAAGAGEERQVRASFIRYLALGGCDDCKTHEKGLRVQGALIFGDREGDVTNGLDLEGCVLAHDLILGYCLFPDLMSLESCSGDSFNFQGSHFLKGILADRLEARHGVKLEAVNVIGEARFVAAKLGSDFDCEDSRFSNPNAKALFADKLTTKGNIRLQGGEIIGEASFCGAKVSGGIICGRAKLFNPSGFAFIADGLKVDGGFFLRSGTSIEGRISLHKAEVDALCDDPDCWPKQPNRIGIDGFRYGTIIGEDAPTDAAARLKWLDKISHMNGFSPQPYEQLATVLRDMGHRSEARDVLIEKERLQRKDRRGGEPSVVFSGLFWLRDQMLKITVRYGHRPLMAFIWLAAFWLAGAFVFENAARNNAFKPNSSRVWQASVWTDCAGPEQMTCYLQSDKGESYPKFNALIYSADTLLPIVDLELQNVWIPDEDKMPWARWYLWLQILAGWALSLLAVAGFSGLIKKSD